MSERHHRAAWTWDEYVAWETQQEGRHEFVDGRVYAMGGGTAAHDVIANTLRRELDRSLERHRCRAHGPDMRIHTATGNGRYPDALIDCGRFVADALDAQEPTVVFEVLSRSTAWIDQGQKLRDYSATRSIYQYVLISQDEPRVMVYLRGESGRLDIEDAFLLEGLDAVLDLPSLGVSIPLSAIYARVDFGKAEQT